MFLLILETIAVYSLFICYQKFVKIKLTFVRKKGLSKIHCTTTSQTSATHTVA